MLYPVEAMASAGMLGGQGDSSAASLATGAQFDFSDDPMLVCSGSSYFQNPRFAQDVVKGVKFSPDGLLMLTATEDRLMTFGLPSHAWVDPGGGLAPTARILEPPRLSWKEAETIYDYAWYPQMNALSNPATAVFACSARDGPIHLWDCVTSELRAAYRGHNAMDEVSAAYSIAFSHDGSTLYAGYDHAVMTFDVSRPGRELSRRLTTPMKRSSRGQKGIIGCIDVAPDHGTYACGSYSGSTWMYDVRSGKPICSLKNKESKKSTATPAASDPGDAADSNAADDDAGTEDAGVAESTSNNVALGSEPTQRTASKQVQPMSGNSPGVTQLRYSPEGTRLYAGYRQSNSIACWDLRKTDFVLHRFERDASSNQRITFDLDHTGSVLITGSRDGRVLVYNTQTATLTYEMCGFPDCVNGVSLHPAGGVFAVATGQRHFACIDDDDDSDASDSGGSERTANAGGAGAASSSNAASSRKRRRTDAAAHASSTSSVAAPPTTPASTARKPSSMLSLWRTLMPSMPHSNYDAGAAGT